MENNLLDGFHPAFVMLYDKQNNETDFTSNFDCSTHFNGSCCTSDSYENAVKSCIIMIPRT